MNRRQYLGLLGAAAIAGCSTESGTPVGTEPGEATRPVSLSADGVTAQTPDVSLDIAFNSHVQTRLPTDPQTIADDGHKWLIVRCDVTNVGDAQRDLTIYQYLIESGGEQYEIVQTKEPWSLAEKTAGPGDTVTGWLVFQIPKSETEATLVVRDQIQTSFEIRFERNGSLSSTIPD